MKTRTVSKWVIGVIAAVVLIGVVGLYCFSLLVSSRWKGVSGIAARFRRSRSQGDGDFGDQPPLFAVAQRIVKNDPEAARATAKGVPDLQAAGRYGETLLDFAVRQSWQRPDLAEAVKTLLSLGADPNYTNGNRTFRDGERRAFIGGSSAGNVGGRRKHEHSR